MAAISSGGLEIIDWICRANSAARWLSVGGVTAGGAGDDSATSTAVSLGVASGVSAATAAEASTTQSETSEMYCHLVMIKFLLFKKRAMVTQGMFPFSLTVSLRFPRRRPRADQPPLPAALEPLATPPP